ncbi:porin family protein [Mucilaginibacter sp. McL0603]|uniref:porin family protein n=1 Tax=Mucilaginibacter sp. McL0603 TaxID=3415670 RepID=UPI003CFB7C36
MNRLLLTFPLVLITTFSFAQTFNLGIKGGVNLSTVAFSGPALNFTGDNQNRAGYQVGVTADVGFQHFSIQPGLFFITKGGKYIEEFDYVSNSQTYVEHVVGNTKYNYLELPVNLLYKLRAAPGVKIYAGGGPYMDYSLSGTSTQHVTGSTTYDYHGDISYGSDHNKDDKRINYGINFIAGVELKKHFTIDLNYSLGLTSIAWGITDKNRTVGLSVGYLF